MEVISNIYLFIIQEILMDLRVLGKLKQSKHLDTVWVDKFLSLIVMRDQIIRVWEEFSKVWFYQELGVVLMNLIGCILKCYLYVQYNSKLYVMLLNKRKKEITLLLKVILLNQILLVVYLSSIQNVICFFSNKIHNCAHTLRHYLSQNP